MNVLSWMETAVSKIRHQEELFYECRVCGTTLKATHEQCAHCGSKEIVEYDI